LDNQRSQLCLNASKNLDYSPLPLLFSSFDSPVAYSDASAATAKSMKVYSKAYLYQPSTSRSLSCVEANVLQFSAPNVTIVDSTGSAVESVPCLMADGEPVVPPKQVNETCDFGWFHVNGTCFQLTAMAMTYAEAKAFCNYFNATLAAPESPLVLQELNKARKFYGYGRFGGASQGYGFWVGVADRTGINQFDSANGA
uniref:C-type lectin domain-containing protein n=1 Tax=Macrostomum lignano TaxID=282301 RepID=A0A1I8JHT8_9PLAT